jgi:putative transposase
VPAYELFSDTEVLGRMAMERMLAGLSTLRYRVGLEFEYRHRRCQAPR